MKISYLPIFDKVLDVIHTANSSLDRDIVRQKVLNLYLETFAHEGAVFFLPDEGGNFSNTIINNLDETFNQRFKKYYCKFDPLKLIRKPQKTIQPPMVRSISYDSMVSTEYYNDFLRPQQIHYKLLAYLGSMEGILGKVVLTRPAGSPCFSENEIRLARAVTPYLAHALYLNDLQRKICLKDNILSSIDNEMIKGMILIDEAMRPVYMNRKARELCCKLAGQPADASCKAANIPPGLMKAFYKMIEEQSGITGGAEIAGGNGVIYRNKSVNLTAHVQLVKSVAAADFSGFYLICVSERNNDTAGKRSDVLHNFNLSRRETEVAEYVFKGLKNSEIAKNLFVSEVTVKKHIQKIYTKLGVRNRASMMNKIMETQSAS